MKSTAGRSYLYYPDLLDGTGLVPGCIVKVVKFLPPNSCHVEFNGKFAGLVSTGSRHGSSENSSAGCSRASVFNVQDCESEENMRKIVYGILPVTIGLSLGLYQTYRGVSDRVSDRRVSVSRREVAEKYRVYEWTLDGLLYQPCLFPICSVLYTLY